MNKIYRSVYNDSLGAWVAVSELDGHQGKRTGGVVKNTLNRAIRGFKLSQIALALGLGLGLSSTAAWAKDAEFSFSDPTIACRPVSSPSDTSFVGGGENNTACNDYAFVGGGRNNTASGKYNFVGGGQNNLAGFPDGNWSFNGEYSSVVGGENNLASGKYTFVGGGENNLASGNYNFIGGGQNNTTSGNYSFVGGGQNNTTSGNYSFVGGGQNNTTSGNYSFVGGGFNSQALGLGSFSGGGFSTYYGYEYAQINGATAYGDNSFAFGAGAVANANDTIAIGRDTVAATTRQSNYEAAVAIGKNAKATAQNGIALGFDISNSGKNTFTIGSNITSTANNAVVLGVGSEGVDDAVSVGSQTSARKIVYVADGKLSEDSTDAVNGSQLHATNTRVDVLDTQVSTNTQSINQLTTDVANNTTNITNLSDTVGKGWSIASKGNAEAQKVAMGDTVEFTNKDGNIAVKHDGLSVSFDLAEELKLTSLTVGDKVTITNTGINAGDTVITNVANGNVAENSKDAVNGGQLFETNTRIDELSGSMSTLDGLAVKYDSDAKDKVTLGNPEKAVTLTNVAAGKLSEDSTDAVTGGQLFDVKNHLENNVSTVANQLSEGIRFGDGKTDNQYALGKTISVLGDDNITSKTVPGGVQLGLANVIKIGSHDIPLSIDGESGVITGLTNTTWPSTGEVVADRAATEGQLQAVYELAATAGGKVKVEGGKNILVSSHQNDENTTVYQVATTADLTANSITFNGTGDSTTTIKLGDNGLDVGGTTITNLKGGEIAKGSTDAVTGGQVFDVKTELSGEIAQVGDKVTQVAGNVTQLTNRITVNEADIVNLKAADALAVKYDGTAKDTITLSGAEGTLLTNLKGGEIAKGSTDAVTGGQMFDMQERFKQNLLDVSGISQGLDFAADSGKFNRKLGETIRVVGSNNITTQANNGTITVSMADNPVFKGQVQAQGGLVVQDHLAVAPGSIIDAGGNPISNIGPGTKPGDAVNVQQLAEVQQQLGGQIGQIHSELDRATKDARGGTAAAMAMANLPQAWRPGQSGVAMSGSTYKGQKGYAIGVSHMSENGKWVFKGSVGGSNRGSTGVAVGAFYSFN